MALARERIEDIEKRKRERQRDARLAKYDHVDGKIDELSKKIPVKHFPGSAPMEEEIS